MSNNMIMGFLVLVCLYGKEPSWMEKTWE